MFTRPSPPMIMAFGQTRPIAYDSWDDAPGYGDQWPLANASLQLRNFKTRGLVKSRFSESARALDSNHTNDRWRRLTMKTTPRRSTSRRR